MYVDKIFKEYILNAGHGLKELNILNVFYRLHKPK